MLRLLENEQVTPEEIDEALKDGLEYYLGASRPNASHPCRPHQRGHTTDCTLQSKHLRLDRHLLSRATTFLLPTPPTVMREIGTGLTAKARTGCESYFGRHVTQPGNQIDVAGAESSTEPDFQQDDEDLFSTIPLSEVCRFTKAKARPAGLVTSTSMQCQGSVLLRLVESSRQTACYVMHLPDTHAPSFDVYERLPHEKLHILSSAPHLSDQLGCRQQGW